MTTIEKTIDRFLNEIAKKRSEAQILKDIKAKDKELEKLYQELNDVQRKKTPKRNIKNKKVKMGGQTRDGVTNDCGRSFGGCG